MTNINLATATVLKVREQLKTNPLFQEELHQATLKIEHAADNLQFDVLYVLNNWALKEALVRELREQGFTVHVGTGIDILIKW